MIFIAAASTLLPAIASPTTTSAAARAEDNIPYCPRSFVDMVRFGRTFHNQIPAILPEKLAWVMHDNADPDCRKAMAAIESGNWQQAVDSYSTAIKTNPKNATAFANRAVCNLMMVVYRHLDPYKWFGGSFEIDKPDSQIMRKTVLDDIDQALTLHPDCGRLLANRAVVYSWIGRKELILAECAKAVRLSPSDVVCLHTAAVNNNLQAHSEEAVALMNKTLALSPHSSLFLTERGVACWRVGDLPGAAESLQRSVSLEPKNPVAWYELGLTRIQQRQFAKGYEALNRATDVREDYVDAWRTRALCAVEQKDYARAIADANRTLALTHGNSSEALYMRGCANHGLNHDREALHDYDSALALKPRQGKVLSDRAVVYAKLGMTKNALADLNKAIAINPENSKALALRAQLGGANGDLEQSMIDNYQARKAAATVDDKAHFSNVTGGVSRNIVSDSELKSQKESLHTYKRGRMPTPEQVESTIAEYSKMINLNSTSGDSYYERGILYLSKERNPQALGDFHNALKYAPPGQVRFLAALFSSVCQQKQHDNAGAQKELATIDTKTLHDPFWQKLLSFLEHKIEPANLLKFAMNGTAQCQAHFFIGLQKSASGDNAAARQNLQWVRDHADLESTEYFLACSELSRIK